MSVRYRMAAALELLRRYTEVFSFFWGRRKTLQPNFFNQQEAEFLPAALSLQESPVSQSLKWTARVLVILVLFTLVWSIFGRIDIVVNANGKIIPSMRTQAIAAIDVASVRALHVTEGQQVRAGDVLMELNSSASDAEHDKALALVNHARLQVARSQSLVTAVEQGERPQLPPVEGVPVRDWQEANMTLDVQFSEFFAKRKRLESEITRYSAALSLAIERADDFKALLKDKDVAHHAWLEKEHARIDLEGQLNDARNQLSTLIAQTLKEAKEAMTEAKKIVSAGAQDVRRSGEYSKLLRLIAPVDGTVQQLNVHTVGGVVPAAQPLMQIVPINSHIEVEAFLENKDVGFVHAGQTAAVKVDAFNYTKYGTIDAKVSHVSQDAIQDEQRGLIYSTKIFLDRGTIFVEGKTMPLSPGMSVNVEIKTGTRRIIEYVLSPLMKYKREAMNER